MLEQVCPQNFLILERPNTFQDYIWCRSDCPSQLKFSQEDIFHRMLDLISPGNFRLDSLYSLLILQRRNKYQVHNCYSFVILEKTNTFLGYNRYSSGSLKRKNTFQHHRCYSFEIPQRPKTIQEYISCRRGCPAHLNIPQRDNHDT
jgi:hypothetical protein